MRRTKRTFFSYCFRKSTYFLKNNKENFVILYAFSEKIVKISVIPIDFFEDESVLKNSKKESQFQRELIKEIKKIFPESIVLKNDANYIQGIPDLIILVGNKWAMLECKKDELSHHQPNQDYYISLLNEMSYASFIYPENKEEVLNEIQQALRDT